MRPAKLATLMGLEPTTFAVTGRRSNQLSYSAKRRYATWWARLGSNQRPPACEADALPLSYAPALAVLGQNEILPYRAPGCPARSEPYRG
jgi:hypothetical protein